MGRAPWIGRWLDDYPIAARSRNPSYLKPTFVDFAHFIGFSLRNRRRTVAQNVLRTTPLLQWVATHTALPVGHWSVQVQRIYARKQQPQLALVMQQHGTMQHWEQGQFKQYIAAEVAQQKGMFMRFHKKNNQMGISQLLANSNHWRKIDGGGFKDRIGKGGTKMSHR